MSEFAEFFGKLFDTSDWPPRWVCGKWTDFHGWLYIGSDVAIWLSYFIIPVIIIWFVQQRPDVPFLPVFWLFGAFIILCGATHFIDAMIFWWPAYRVSALLRFITAIVSFITVFALIRDLPKALDLKPQRKDLGDDRKKQIENDLAQRDETIRKLRAEIEKLKS